MSMLEHDRSDPTGLMHRDPFYKSYKSFYSSSMPHGFLDEWSYVIDKKKMNEIADKVDEFYEEIPTEIKEEDIFGKFRNYSAYLR